MEGLAFGWRHDSNIRLLRFRSQVDQKLSHSSIVAFSQAVDGKSSEYLPVAVDPCQYSVHGLFCLLLVSY